MRKSVLVGIGVVIGALIVPGVAVAKSVSEVIIANDTTQPVPVVAQGTSQVAGTVNIGNTPGVNVVSEPTSREPYQKTIFFNQGPSTCTQFVCPVSFDPVPAGKRLVITYASARWALTPGGNLATASVGINGNDSTDPQVLLPAAVLSGTVNWVTAGPLTVYAEAGDVPTISLQGQFVQPVSNTAEVAIVGYFVDA